MTIRKVKTSPKVFLSNPTELQKKVVSTMRRVSDIVGATFGPGGRSVLIEADYPGLPNKNTKDGVTVFNSLGAFDSYEHLIIEQVRDAAKRTASEAGDGPQPLWSKILTPNGFIAMGEAKVGMEICGTDGSVQTIVGVFPKGQKEIYKVTLSEGRVVECCEDHLWTVTTNYGVTKTLTTKDMLSDFVKLQPDQSNKYKYFTPKTVVSYGKKQDNLPLDPYLVGLLIGDGSLGDSGSIELSLGKKKEHVLSKVVLPTGLTLDTKYVESKNSYRVKLQGKTVNGKTPRDLVEEVGLRNTNSHNKHIPKRYLMSSLENRKMLLQGLIDTDGHVNTRGLFEFSTVSSQLAEDFAFLARSLGESLHVSVYERKDGDGSYGKSPVHRITQLEGYKFGDKIVNIEPTGILTEMQCIKVSNPDNLYITDNFVVTHNTTTATILSSAIIENLYNFCQDNPKLSPQRVARDISKYVRHVMVPLIKQKAIKIEHDKNLDLLKKVAKVSANGDEDMASAVIKAYELLGYGDNSHITIKEMSGPQGYDISLIEGFPVNNGYEESMGKHHQAFLNDQANQRIYLEKPLFLLFDGQITDLVTIMRVLEEVGEKYTNGESEFKNLVIFAHGYSDGVLTNLMYNFVNPNTINVVPMITPKALFPNAQTSFLGDLAAFTNAKVFGIKDKVADAKIEDLGTGSEYFEAYRYRSTIVGNPDELNLSVRVDDLTAQKKHSESKAESQWLDERLGKLTSGIAKIVIYGGSNGELKEAHDRCEDAVCSVRSAIKHGALPGGCRMLLDLIDHLDRDETAPYHVKEVMQKSLMEPMGRLLINAGYITHEEDEHDEVSNIINYLSENPDKVFDVSEGEFGTAEELGVFDSVPAVEEALKNAVSIASVMGTIGGIVAYPRDDKMEREEAKSDSEFQKMAENPLAYTNEANERI